MRCIPGLNCRFGRRGLCRSPVDMAEDSKHWAIAEWLRAKGGMSGDGTFSGFLLQSWKDKGWQGDSIAFRTYKKDTWASQEKKWEEWRSSGYEPKESWWSGGYEPKEQPASRRNAADWSDWKQGGGTGGGGGGSTGSGHSQPVPAPWHRAREERASSSGGGGPVPKASSGYEPGAKARAAAAAASKAAAEARAAAAAAEEPAPSPPARRSPSVSSNKIGRSPAPFTP